MPALAPWADPALWLLLAALPACLWAAWSDLARMTIPNRAVLTLTAAFAAVGLLALPLPEYAARWGQLALVLALGFALSTLGALGAGDAKFAAAMAPFVDPAHLVAFLLLLAATVPAAFALHRAARALPMVRAAAPGWESWHRPREFPLGLALGAALPLHLALAAAGAL